MKLKNISGMSFGRLLVLKYIPGSKGVRLKWECLCDCGNTTIVFASNLLGGKTRSCGCFMDECAKAGKVRHGYSKRKEYKAWLSIKERCYNSKNKCYNHYGGRGINMHNAWKESFVEFFAYIGEAPSSHHSIDRIDNNGNYEPGNVRWATQREQVRNTRRNHILEAFGKRQCLSDWAKDIGISARNLYIRLNKGWDVERALSTPPRRVYGSQTVVIPSESMWAISRAKKNIFTS